MGNDWKDALSALRGNLDEPKEPEKTENEPVQESGLEVQKTPLTVMTDKKGRNGKTATIIEGFSVNQKRVEEIAKNLKQKLGVGGSVREGEILIQGDHKEAVKKFLQNLNFKVR